MECIKSSSFSILINGSPHGYFYPKCGIRQGDPLSPYIFLFLLWNRLLDILIIWLLPPKSHVGILSSPGGFRISNLVFADDCLLFAQATPKGVRNVFQILKMFAPTVGQQVIFINLLFIFRIILSTRIRTIL